MARTAPVPNLPPIPGRCPSIAVLAGGGDGGGGSGGGAGPGGDSAGAGTGSGRDDAAEDGRGAPEGAPDYAQYPECGYASHPVDVVTGRAITHPLCDLTLPGPLPLEVRRMYSSKMAYRDAGMGYGWAHSLGWEIEVGRRRVAVWNEQGALIEVPLIQPGEETLGPFGWLIRREAWGFSVDAGDGLWRRFAEAADGGRRYRLTAIEDRNNNRIALTYRDGCLVEVLDSAGRTVRVQSTPEGRIAALEVKNAVARGQWIRFAAYTYDEEGDLCAARDADGHAAHYTYEADHLLASDTDRAGLTFHFVYDDRRRCVEAWGEYCEREDPSLAPDLPRTLADGMTRIKGIHHCKFEYHDDGYTEVADSTEVRRYFGNRHGLLDKSVQGGGMMTAVYSDDGHIVSRTDALGATTTWLRDARGGELQVTDPLGRVTATTRDDNGLPIEIVDPAGGVTAIGRDRFGNIETVRDPMGAVTSYRYDARGLLVEKIAPDGGKTAFEHDAHGNLTKITLPGGGVWQRWFDGLGRLLAETDPEGQTTRFAYSDGGYLTAIFDAAGGATRVERDGEGRTTRVTDPGGRVRTFTWGGYNKLAAREDGNGNRVLFLYDLEGQLVHVENERGEVHRLEYSAGGLLVGEETFDGRRFRYRYDPARRPVEIEASAAGSAEAGVDKALLEYDLAGQLIRRERGEVAQTFVYGPCGEIESATSPAGTVRFERDKLGRIAREVQEVGGEEHAVEIEYDAAGRRASRATSLGHTCAFERDAAGLRTRTILDGEVAIGHRPDRLGRERARSLPGGGALETELDPLGRVARRRVLGPTAHLPLGRGQPDWVGPVQGSATVEQAYRYDGSGEIIEAWDKARGLSRYDYDPTGQILASMPEGARSELFRYDPAGNRFESGAGAATREYGAGSRLLHRGNTEYSYDAGGRLAEKRVRDAATGAVSVWTYHWNDASLLERIDAPGGARVELTYDAFARRVQKRVSRPDAPGGLPVPRELTRFVWDGDALVHEIRTIAAAANDPVVEVRTYVFEDDAFTPAAHSEGGAWFHYVNTPGGAPDRLVDDTGAVACELEWRASGAARARPGGRTQTPLRLPGQYEDLETGLAYNRFRYYDPESGTYISPDPIGLDGGPNPYAYAPNTLAWCDPMGLAGYRTWNDFQAGTAGKYGSRQEAATAWNVYKETNRDCTKVPAVGRLPDTEAAETIGMRRLNTTGWTPAVNDAWVQGGIDRGAPFYMASPASPANLYNPPGSRFPETVYKRELDQLTAAGYRPSSCGTYMLPPGMSSPPP